MDIFGFKRRKQERLERKRLEEAKAEQEKLERIKAEKKAYQERKQLIVDYLEKYHKEQLSIAMDRMERENEAATLKNNTCPKCGCTDTINVMKNINGEIHGKGSSHTSMNTFGYSHTGSSSKIDGHINTFPVNKCKSCGNEWAVEEIQETPDFVLDEYDTYCSYLPEHLVAIIYDYLKPEFDPYDITDHCNSKEEKQEELVRLQSSSDRFNEYRKAPRYMVEHAIYLGLYDRPYLYKKEPKFGTANGKDQYSYTLPDETWEVVKKLIGWTGPEKQQ